jgi:hypothetical protein
VDPFDLNCLAMVEIIETLIVSGSFDQGSDLTGFPS